MTKKTTATGNFKNFQVGDILQGYPVWPIAPDLTAFYRVVAVTPKTVSVLRLDSLKTPNPKEEFGYFVLPDLESESNVDNSDHQDLLRTYAQRYRVKNNTAGEPYFTNQIFSVHKWDGKPWSVSAEIAMTV